MKCAGQSRRLGVTPARRLSAPAIYGAVSATSPLGKEHRWPPIIIADNPLNEIGIARELLPPSLDAVVSRDTGALNSRPPWPIAVCLVGFGDGTMDDAFYKSAPNLKLVQLLSAGYDRCDIEAARRAGVPICNNGGANSTAVSEHALLLIAGSLPPGGLAAYQRCGRTVARQQCRRHKTL